MYAKQTTVALALAVLASAKPFPRVLLAGNDGVLPPQGAMPSGTSGVGPTGTGGVAGPTGTGTSGAPKLNGVAAWWGQSGGKLEDVCKDDAFSAVVISFVNNYFGAGGFPALNLGAASMPPNEAQKKAGATDLADGTSLAPAIKACQDKKKKVFLSLGGEAAEKAKLKDDAEGAKLADTIWNLFLGGKDEKTKAIRPFGDVILDGIDLDIENKAPAGYNGLVDQLRKNFASDKTRKYMISAAPQCPRNGGKGDASIGDDVLKKTDITWVQFYNNKEAMCNHGQDGFVQSVKDWAKAVEPSQLWIGAPGSGDAKSASNGFAPIDVVKKEAQELQALNLPNLGGWALWDAATAMGNSNYQKAVADAIKPAGNKTMSRMARHV